MGHRLSADARATVGVLDRDRALPQPREGPYMLKMKYLANRAILFLGSMAAFAFVIDGAKRW